MNQPFKDFSEPVLMHAIEDHKKELSKKTDYGRRSEQ